MQQKRNGNHLWSQSTRGSRLFHTSLNLSDSRCILFILTVYFILAVVVAIINPLYEPTDEIRHYRFIRILVTEKRLPVQGAEPLRAQSHHPPVYYALSALMSAWVPTSHTGQYDPPRNPHWGYRNWEVGVDNKLQYWHPPGEFFQVENVAVYIARLVNVVLGALTIGLTYALGARIWRTHKATALIPAAIVAFNPQFVYLSAAINNDIAAALSGTAVLYTCLVLLQDGLDKRISRWCGFVYGFAILCKIHLVTLAPVIALVLAIAVWRQKPFTLKSGIVQWLRASITIAVIAAILAGWWFIRNILLYGDLTGMSRLNEMWGGRSAIDSLWALQQGFPYLWSSLWGRFGFGQIPLPSPIYTTIAFVCAVGLCGCLQIRKVNVSPTILVVFLFAILLFLGIVSYYILIQPAGAMGRFLFPVLPVFVVLVTTGWCVWVPNVKALSIASFTLMSLYVLAAFCVFWYPAVSHPPQQSVDDKPLYQLGDVARISRIALSSRSISPGDSFNLAVTLHPLRHTEEPVTVYVHLIDEVGAVIAQRDTYPGLGRAPTTSWRVGHPFEDVYRIDVPESVYSPNVAQVKLGMYTSSERLNLFDISIAHHVPEGILCGEVVIGVKPGSIPNRLNVNFNNQVRLIGYEIEPRYVQPGDSFELTLYWEVISLLDRNLNVFAQVLDDDWQVWGSKDGGHPDWIADQVITETRRITLLPDTPSGTYPIQVGLFTDDGRLPIISAQGLHLDNRYSLGPIRVE